MPQEYDESAIKGVLAELTPANVRIMWSSKLFQVCQIHITSAVFCKDTGHSLVEHGFTGNTGHMPDLLVW